MAKKISEKITDILNSMDSTDYLNVIRALQEKVGDKELLNILEAVSSSKTSFDESDISEWAADCTDMDDREWYRIACDDGYGGYVDSGEHACDVILDNLRDAFEKDLNQMVLVGKKEEASAFLMAIAAGLRQGQGILAEEAEDFINDFADHLEECAESEDFKDVFEW